MTETPVLIVGGGPVGLALALDLAWHGQRSTLIEQDAGTALVLLAKAGTLNERTMEFCRRWGIRDAVANCGFPADAPRDTFYCTSLTGFVLGVERLPSAQDRKPPAGTPEILRKCPQHLFDPLLARAAQATGLVDLRYGTRCDGFTQDAAGVTVQLSDGRGPSTLRAGYVVGCDGAGSAIRKALGIGFPGPDLGHSVSAMVRIPNLDRFHGLGPGERYMFVGPTGTWANLTSVDGIDLWRFTLVGSAGADPREADIEAALHRAFGRDDVPFEILRLVPWRRSQCHADTYRNGRVLLAGDAAHTTSPTGGHGLNTGLGDVASLGWMLDAALRGWGGDRLLDAYGLERRPVAIRNCGSSTKNFGNWLGAGDAGTVLDDTPEGAATRARIGARMSASLVEEWHSLGIGLGYRLEGSPVIIPDGTPETPDEVSVYVPTARPGHRAPHAFLPDGRSTIDLFGHGFVLLDFGAAPGDVASFVAAAGPIPLRVEAIADPAIAALYERKLVLVRPDGHVAWRGDTPDRDPGDILAIVTGNHGDVA